MDEKGLDDSAIEKGIREGLVATKPISCNVYIENNDGKMEMKDADGLSKDFIEVEDYSVRHKYLETLLKIKQRIRKPLEEVAEKQGDMIVNFINLIENVNTNKELGSLDRLTDTKRDVLDKFLAKRS